MPACSRCATVSPPEARFCMGCGAPLTEGPGQVRRARKTVTVVFSDLVGSTDIGDRLDVEALRDVLVTYFSTMADIVSRHGGRIERLLGDAVLAVFGLPLAAEDDALRAVRAAWEMQNALVDVNARLPAGLGMEIVTRTGVNSGEVLVDQDVLSHALTGNVVGDAVNVAARLESAAAPGEILLGDLTRRLVEASVETVPVELVVKGKPHPITAHRLLDLRSHPKLNRRLRAPLVGRAKERALILSAFRDARSNRQPIVVPIIGAAGVGKSRLVESVIGECAGDATVVTGRCVTLDQAGPLGPMRDPILQLAGEPEAEGVIAALARTGPADWPGGARALAASVAGHVGLGPPPASSAEADHEIATLIHHAARTRPVVGVIEDLHWARPALLSVIDALLHPGSNSPVLVLCTARDGFDFAWREDADVRPLAVTDLAREDCAELVHTLLDGDAVAARLAPPILEASAGSPLIVEEALAMLVDDGLLHRGEDGWVLTDRVDSIRIPPTIEAILASRLDHLPREARATIEVAAVIGPAFTESELAALGGEQRDGAVEELAVRQMITSEGDGRHRFHHALIRTAVYDATPKRRRAELHLRQADLVDDSNQSDPQARRAEVVGAHLERAIELQRALGVPPSDLDDVAGRAGAYLTAAGTSSSAMADLTHAVDLMRRADGVLPEGDASRLGLLMELCDALCEVRLWEAAADALDRARAIATDERNDGALALCDLTTAELEVYSGSRAAREAIPEMHEALNRLENLRDDRSVLRGWIHAMRVAYEAMSAADVHFAASRALALARRTTPSEVPYCLVGPASTLVEGSLAVPDAIKFCEDALQEIDPNSLPFALVERSLGAVLALGGDHDAAEVRLAASCAALEGRRSVLWLQLAWAYRARSHWLAGQHDEADRWFTRAVMPTAAGEDGGVITTEAWRAVHLAATARFDPAAALAREIAERAEPSDIEVQTFWRAALAVALSARGDHREARWFADEALEISAPVDMFWIRGEALAAAGQVLVADGRADEGRALLREALDLYEHAGAAGAVSELRARCGLEDL